MNRPTPETDSEYKEAQDFPRSAFVVPLAQFLEVKRERDESHDQLKTMREAIGVAYESLNVSTTFGTTPKQDQALTKLQPFLP